MRNLLKRGIAPFALLVALAACDSPTEADDQHGHVAGMEIVNSEGVLVSVSSTRQVTGELSVQAGTDIDIAVYYLDRDGDRISLTDDLSLEWEVADPSIAQIDGHDDHQHLEGVSAGSTTVTFSLIHGSHSDYESPAIPIVVTE